jgi:hypothetical protein
VVLVPLPPAVGRSIDRATGTRTDGPILLNCRGARMGPPRRHPPAAPTRRKGPGSRLPGRTRTCSGTPLSRPCSTLA